MWDRSSAADECTSILSFDGTVGDGATASGGSAHCKLEIGSKVLNLSGGSAPAVSLSTFTNETFFLEARSATASWARCMAAKDDRRQ